MCRGAIGRYSFKFEAFERDCVLEGSTTSRGPLLHEADTTAFEARHPAAIGTTERPEPRA
jgi:hypothetical protein